MVSSGQLKPPRTMLAYSCLSAYWDEQRERVARRGCCDAGCDLVEQHVLESGRVVCPHTFQPCQRIRLSKLLALLAKVNA
jgi:hypothetical protein